MHDGLDKICENIYLLGTYDSVLGLGAKIMTARNWLSQPEQECSGKTIVLTVVLILIDPSCSSRKSGEGVWSRHQLEKSLFDEIVYV